MEMRCRVYLDCECVRFVIAGWSKVEITTQVGASTFCIQLSSILFFSNLFEQKLFKSSKDHYLWYLTKSQNNCLFTLKPHHALAAFFFSLSTLCNQLLLISQISQSDIAPSMSDPRLDIQTASQFWRFSLIDQPYAKGVYFCSFVTKSNQACTKYSPKCIQSFL